MNISHIINSSAGWIISLLLLICLLLALRLRHQQRHHRHCQGRHHQRDRDEALQSENHRLLRQLLDNLPQLVAAKDEQGRYIECNQSYLDFLGLTREQVLGRTTRDLFEDGIYRSMEQQDEQVLRSKKAHEASRWLTSSRGADRLISTEKVPLLDAESRLCGVLSISEDITSEDQMRRIDKHRNSVLEKLAQGASLNEILNDLVIFTESLYPGLLCSVLLLDDSGQYLQLGVAPSLPDFYNQGVDGLKIGDGVGSCGTAAYSGRPVIVEDIAHHAYWKGFTELAQQAGLAACWSMPVKNRQGQVLGTFAIYYTEPSQPTPDQMQLMMVNAHLAGFAIESARMDQQLSQLSQAVEHSASFVMITDREQRIDYANHSLIEATGYSCQQLKGRQVSLLTEAISEQDTQPCLDSTVLEGEIWHGEQRFCGRDGQGFWVMTSVTPIRNAQEEITHLVWVSEDITALKEEQARMEKLAFYDPLTGLANRRLFKDRLDVALKQAQRQQQTLALMYLDLDRFKAVNDDYGHEIGDELLKEMALRLQQTLRESDLIARIGGDEFNILLPDIRDGDAAEAVADKVLAAVVQPFVTGDIRLEVSASIGLTLYPDDAADAKQLIKNADVAMYRSKAEGRNCRLRYAG